MVGRLLLAISSASVASDEQDLMALRAKDCSHLRADFSNILNYQDRSFDALIHVQSLSCRGCPGEKRESVQTPELKKGNSIPKGISPECIRLRQAHGIFCSPAKAANQSKFSFLICLMANRSSSLPTMWPALTVFMRALMTARR
jgi:hypothetical protein